MKLNFSTAGITFTQHIPKDQTLFERLFEIFKELITHTSGDFDEAIDWLRELDQEYGLTNEKYTIDNFIEDKTILWWGGKGHSAEDTAFQNLKPKLNTMETKNLMICQLLIKNQLFPMDLIVMII